MAALTDAHARVIANAVIQLDTLERILSESERLGQRLQAREHRRAVAAARHDLHIAITLAREVGR